MVEPEKPVPPSAPDGRTAGQILHARGWRQPFTVEERVRSWARLVSQIETGYTDMVYEYLNDLSPRKWLHQAWILLPAVDINRWGAEVEQLDRRFRDATVWDDGRALGEFFRIDEDEWWLRRYPKVLVGALAD
ncbi:hypothetical protein, partial [Kitasatospora nipponensis]